MTLTFHNESALKARLLERIGAHEQADSLMQGVYWEQVGDAWRGCAIGCSLRDLSDHDEEEPPDGWHAEMERVLGIPEWLAALEDHVFEGLPLADAKLWPRRFSEAVPVGADLSRLADRLAVRRLREECLPLAPSWPPALREQVVPAIHTAIEALADGRNRAAAELRADVAQTEARETTRKLYLAIGATDATLSARSASLAARAARQAVQPDTAAWVAADLTVDAVEAAVLAAVRRDEAPRDAPDEQRDAAWGREADRIIDELVALTR